MTERLRLALVGCGGIAQAHWNGIDEGHAPRVDVTAVVDADAEAAARMAGRTGAPAYTSLDEAIAAGGFDAVDIMLPHFLHEEAATRCFAAGLHVLLEKPMAMTLDSCERILAAAARAGTTFMVAEQSEYWPDAIAVRQLIRDGLLGELITGRALFGGGTPRRPPREPLPWRYRLAEAGGGITMDGGAHWIRPLRMWFGDVDEVVGITGRPVTQMEGESLSRALLRFESGVVAALDCMHVGFDRRRREEFRVTGTLGEVVIDKGPDGGVRFFDHDTPEGRLIDTGPLTREAAFGREIDDFCHAVLDGRAPAAGPEVSLGELRTALAIYRSAKSGRWEKVWA
jgi:UDP-N-acetyl-2-amino-2-deoxyglucuronate dehydrogenase